MPIPVNMERRRRVWNYKAQHPDATSAEIGAALGVPERTVRMDITAAELAVNETASDALRAGILSRTMQAISALWPGVEKGNVRSVEGLLACHKELRDMFGLDAPKEARLTVEIRQMAERMAPLYGLSADEVVAEAERILRDTQGVTA